MNNGEWTGVNLSFETTEEEPLIWNIFDYEVSGDLDP
jgi:hypothetical protein